MSKGFDMELFLAGVLTGSPAPVNVTCVKRWPSKPQSLSAGNATIHGLGSKSISHGF
jgi:hypothetical protein